MRLTEPDDTFAAAVRNLRLSPDERVRNMLAAQRFIEAGRSGKRRRTKSRA